MSVKENMDSKNAMSDRTGMYSESDMADRNRVGEKDRKDEVALAGTSQRGSLGGVPSLSEEQTEKSSRDSRSPCTN